MKKILLFVFAMVTIAITAGAQKYAIIDTRYILEK